MKLSYKNGHVFITHRIGRDWPHPEHKAYRIEPLRGLIGRWLHWFFVGLTGPHWRNLKALHLGMVRRCEWRRYDIDDVDFGIQSLRDLKRVKS